MAENLEIAKIVHKVICLPRVFTNGEKSAFSLLRDSGYFESYHLVTEADFIAALKDQPGSADHWLAWSEDKRARGPFISFDGGDEYVVGSYPDRGDAKKYRDK